MKTVLRLSTISCSMVAMCISTHLLAHPGEAAQTEREGSRVLDLSVELKGEPKTGEGLDLMVTYSDKGFGWNVDGAFQIGRTRPGLIVTIVDERGKTVSESGDDTGSMSGIRLGPHDKTSEVVNLPVTMTPQVPGRYTLLLEYQQGVLEGQNYVRRIEVRAKPLLFVVAYSGPVKEEQFSGRSYESWKKKVIGSADKTRRILFSSTVRDVDSRRFLTKAICDPSLALEVKKDALQLLKNREFPYEQGLVDLIETNSVDISVKIAVIDMLPWMKSQGPMSPSVVLRRMWNSRVTKQDLHYRLAVLNSLFRSGGLTPGELRSEVEKEDEPNLKLLALSLLLSGGDIQGAKIIATQLRDSHFVASFALGSYIEIGTDQTISNVAEKYLKLIEQLEKEEAK